MKKRLILVFVVLSICAYDVVFVYAENDTTSNISQSKKSDKIVNLQKDSNIISGVSIIGLQNIKMKSVLSVVSLKKGKCYSIDGAREDVRSILDLGYFDNVEFHFDNYSRKLTFIVTEKPYIEHIAFKGNCEFTIGKLRNTSLLKEKDYYDLVKLEETKKKLSTLYGDKGYADCQIEVYPTVNTDTNKMTITFLITENNKIVIGGVQIEGVISFKEKKIFKIMKTKSKKIFKEDVFQKDLKAIEAFYKNNGFMDYQFVQSTTTYNDARTEMFLKLNISEGIKYEIGSITYDGNFVVDDKEINKIIKIKKGQIFNQQKIIETVQNIHESYSDKGYLHAVVNPSLNKEGTDRIVDINLSIKENSVVYVGNVYIDGLISTKDKVIRRAILVKPGEALATRKMRRSVEKIYNLGFIDGVEPQILPTGTPDIMDLAFSITEGKPGMITAGVGYSSVDEWLATGQLRHMNIFGLGQILNFSCEVGGKRKNYEIDWTEPWIFNKNASLNLSIFDTHRKNDYASTTNAYEENRTGFSVKVGPRVSDYISLSFGYTYENVGLSNIHEDLKKNDKKNEEFKKSLRFSEGKVSSVSSQIVYDSRDYIYDPSRGNRQLAYLQLADKFLGGDKAFVKGVVKSTWYFSTLWRFVLSVNLHCGVITPSCNQSDVPMQEKFHLGGPDSIRGYKYRTEIGPDSGGKIMGLLNFEYKFPIVSEKGRSILLGAIFYDIGGCWEDCSKITDQTFKLGDERESNLRSGVGFEIRLATPVFPIRIGYGYGLNHKKGETLGEPYFTFNYGF
ncbi:MAG: outer membrane protein assembly factor BamA [Endomicrobium sp.]|jgi:outer membrane protein insertion porin family|nr:outer membrane protein assembly factor BamA [Endomicrobium sp.]